ncbi:hypothetical protein M758_1G206200 [Ceratodon purpureus]|nr:hypothetical protein M758_1G206200 [Ceratodon purpureus]
MKTLKTKLETRFPHSKHHTQPCILLHPSRLHLLKTHQKQNHKSSEILLNSSKNPYGQNSHPNSSSTTNRASLRLGRSFCTHRQTCITLHPSRLRSLKTSNTLTPQLKPQRATQFHYTLPETYKTHSQTPHHKHHVTSIKNHSTLSCLLFRHRSPPLTATATTLTTSTANTVNLSKHSGRHDNPS